MVIIRMHYGLARKLQHLFPGIPVHLAGRGIYVFYEPCPVKYYKSVHSGLEYIMVLFFSFPHFFLGLFAVGYIMYRPYDLHRLIIFVYNKLGRHFTPHVRSVLLPYVDLQSSRRILAHRGPENILFEKPLNLSYKILVYHHL